VSEPLKPCPKCQNAVEVRDCYDGCPGNIIKCDNCSISLWLGLGWDIVAEWNDRTPSTATAKMVQMQQDMLDVVSDLNLPQFQEEQEAQRAFIAEWTRKKKTNE